MAGIFQSGVFDMGFDMDPTATQIFTQAANGSANSSNTPYSFGYSWSCGGTTSGILLGTNLTTLIVGANLYISSALPSSSGILYSFYDATGGGTQVSLRVNSTGQLQFYLGSGTGTTIGSASAAGTVQVGKWVYIEALVTISATVGVVTCYVNGTQVITATGQNTKSTSNTFVNAFQFEGANGGGSTYFDDWYMLDSTGSSPFNTFLTQAGSGASSVQIRGDAPNADSAVGGRNAWTGTPATGSNTYQNVAHIPANSSDYDYDDNPGDYDMFRFPSLPSNVAAVLAVDEWALVGLDSAGSRTVELNCYSNGTDSPGSAFTPAAISSPTYYNLVQTVDPHTSSAWTVANAGAAELGMKVQS
jgi:hypothetical protein